jgi:hypothetical protein
VPTDSERAPTDSETAAIEQFLARLGRAFDHMPAAERDEMVAEARGHLLERLEAEPDAADAVGRALRAFGDPEELAAQHRTATLLRRAAASRSPWTVVRGALRWARTSVAGFVTFLLMVAGYGSAAVCYLSVFLKPILPERIGLWLRQEQQILTLGYWDGRLAGSHVYGISVRPPASFVLGTLSPTEGPMRELLGPWLFPVGVVVGGLFVIATTLATRWAIRRYGLRKASPSVAGAGTPG